MSAAVLRRLIAGACALSLAAGPALALPSMGGGYSVSGKKGPFIKQVAGRNFAGAAGAGAALGLADDAMNRGEFQAARLRMPQTEALVQQLLSQVDGQWPYAKRPVKVQILGLNQYGAQSLPDGSLVVSFGLLEHAQSDDEVAFILGHELGHVRLNHFASGVVLDKRKQAISQLGAVYVMGSSLRSGAMDLAHGGSGVGAIGSAADAASRRASAAGDLIHYINDVLIAPAWSRAQEDEADAVGFDMAEAAQFAADSGSSKVFDTIQADADNRAAQTQALQAQMRKEIGQAAGTSAVQAVAGGGSVSGIGMGMLKVGGRMALAAAGSQEGGPKHRTPEQRRKGMADYTADAYPQGVALRDERHAWLDQVRASAEYQQAKVAVFAVQNAMKARADGTYPAAEAALSPAFRTQFRQAPLVLNEAARLQDDMGRTDQADALFMSAHRSPDQTVDGYIDHVRMLYRTGRYPRAEQIVQQGAQRFGDDKPFLSLQVAIAEGQGQKDRSNQLLQRCVSYGREDLSRDCRLAAGQEGAGGGRDSKDGTQTAAADKPARAGLGSVLGHLPFPPH